MEILLNPDGSRNRDYRPYINMEESSLSPKFFDPLGYNLNSYMYERNYGVAETFMNYSWQNVASGKFKPVARINRNGQPQRPIPIPGWSSPYN